jgi:hypothetical protein
LIFPQLYSKFHGISRKDGSRHALSKLVLIFFYCYGCPNFFYYNVCSVFCILCKCVLLPPGVNPIAVKYFYVSFYQATNHLSLNSDKLTIYLETFRHLRNQRMPDSTYIYFILVIGFLFSYRMICEWNFRKRLVTVLTNITLPTLQPEDSLPCYNCVTALDVPEG